jgi:hypothetical protein
MVVRSTGPPIRGRQTRRRIKTPGRCAISDGRDLKRGRLHLRRRSISAPLLLS